MAQQTVLISDLDGKKADETVRFGVDGDNYEIDLSARQAATMRQALAEFIARARTVVPERSRNRGPNSRKAHARRTARDAEFNRAVRDWAREQGLTVNERGRVPAEIVSRYETAQAELAHAG